MNLPQHDDGANSARLRRLINGYQISQAIHVVASLGVVDALAEGPLEIDQLADKTATDVGTLYRVMRALAAVGLFAEDGRSRFSLTELGAGLRTDSPQSQARWARFAASPPMWSAWSGLATAVATGRPAFTQVHGMDIWEYRRRNPMDRSLFDAAMGETSARVARQMMIQGVLAGARHIVDVGGGDGAILAHILALQPDLTGTTIDRQSSDEASALFRAAGVSARAIAMKGDFFDELPANGDIYLLKFVLHDWQDGEARRILKSCRRAMRASARLLIIERLIAAPNEGADGKLSDLNMLVNPGGQERTADEFAALLSAAQLSLTCKTELLPDLFVIEARRADAD